MLRINNDIKYYTNYINRSKIISYKTPQRKDKKGGGVVRGVYDIETNNSRAKFIVGGLALNNGNNSEDTRENYNISFHNKPYLILNEIWNHNKEIGGFNKYEIAVHNLMFDIQSLLYNILEKGKITYKEPTGYGKQDRNTYSIIMNEKKQIYSCTINYCGINIMFWDTFKLYPAPLSKLCKVYNIKNYKLESGEETYNSESFEDYIKNKINVDYLINDLLSVAELVDRNYYKKKTASGNAWDSLKNEICLNLHLKKKSDSIISTIIEFWGDDKINDYYLPAYSGGFCYANPINVNKLFENVIHLDINSSYPNAMNRLEFPLTCKLSNKIENDRFIIYLKGDFTLKKDSFPIIKHPFFMNQYLSHFNGDILLTDIEYKRILKNYNVKNIKIIEVLNFPKTEKILSSFVQKNYAMKQNSKGFLREKAKLNLNSAYGKLAEHHNGQYYECYISDKKTLNFKISSSTINLIDTEKSRCVIWAIFITAFAREKIYKCIDVLGDTFLYTDTDSIFTTLPLDELTKRLESVDEHINDKNLGDWKIEGISPYFKSIRAKCYLKTDDNKLNYVVAGYNGKDLVQGYQNENIDTIGHDKLMEIFNNFKIGAVVHDKETSKTFEYGIKQVKMLTDFEIKDKVNNFEFVQSILGKKEV